MKSRWFAFCAILLSAFLAFGCASKTTPTFTAKYYPDCYDPIEKLCKDQSNEAEVKGAVTGGVLGALGGAIVGGLATGKVEGALIGAGVGAASGALTGFFAARLSKIQDQNQRLAEYQTALGEKSKAWDIDRASVERAYQCYGDQIKLLKTAMRAKKMTREEFKARMDEIYNGIQYINTYWADAQNRMDATLAEGDKWLQAEDEAAAKAKKQKQMAAQIKRQKSNTTRLRENNTINNNRVNKLKNDVQVAYRDSLKEFMQEDRAFTYGDDFLAMLWVVAES